MVTRIFATEISGIATALSTHEFDEDDLHRAFFQNVPAWPADFDLFTYLGCEPDKTAQWMRWNEFVGHLTMVLLKVDRASMHHSLEVRVPLLDREVIDVASRVDWQLMPGFESKSGKITAAPLARPPCTFSSTERKRGFEVPMNAWLRGPLKRYLSRIRNRTQRDLRDYPSITKKLRCMFQQHIDNQADRARGLWTLLSLALWEKKHYRARFGEHDFSSHQRSRRVQLTKATTI